MKYNINIPGTESCDLILSDINGKHHFYSNNIIRLEANDNYTVIYFDNRRPFVVSKVLKVYEEILGPYGFIRTHRSHLVNGQYIKALECSIVIMQDNSTVEVAKRKLTKIRKQLSH